MGWRENLNSDSKDFIDFNDKNTSNGELNHLNQFNREVWGWSSSPAIVKINFFIVFSSS